MQSCLVILAINWVFQGMRGMQRKELSFRLAFALLVGSIVVLAMHRAGLGGMVGTLAGIFAGHSVNFLLNGQFWVCARYCRHYRGNAAHITEASAALASAVAALPWLEEAAFIGSRARGGRPTDRSDIDLRLVFPAGPMAWWRTNLLLLRLRCSAFFSGLPLDLYAYDDPEALRRFDQGEPLLVVKDRQGRLGRLFPERVVAFAEGPAG